MGQRRHGTARGQAPEAMFVRDGQDRMRIAQAAAKLIAEHGIADWALAKRKAVRQLMLSERHALPGNDEIELALAEYHALFGGVVHVAMLRERREEALRWMRRLAQFEPELTGGVAAGWATTYSDIRIELVAADTKMVELALLNANVNYRAMHSDHENAADLFIETAHGGVRLAVSAPTDARQRSRRDAHGNEPVRLDAGALEALLAERQVASS